MSRYRSAGGLDDPRVEDGDVGFRGVNLRLPSWQLPAGMLTLSQNGRIDGEWQPRRGAVVVSAGEIDLGDALRLPFWLMDTVGGAAIVAASRSGTLVTLSVIGHGLAVGESAYLTIEGLGFTTVDPNGIQLVTPTDFDTLTFDIAGAVGLETYTIAGGDDVVRAVIDDFATGTVLASCVYSDPNSQNDESIFLAFGTVVKRVDLTTSAVSAIDLPPGETLDGEAAMIQAFDKVFIFRAGEVGLEWSPGDTSFAAVPSGAYTQPQVLTAAGASTSIADGLVTFTVAGNTSINAGDMITIYSATDTRFAEVVGNQYQVVFGDATTVTCYIGLADSASGSNNIQLGRQVSVGGGFIHQPGFPWAVYFQRRLWGPYQYDESFTHRGITDELIVSDILDADTYDAIQNQFRITGGTADFIVGLHPFFDDTLLVFNRNSIHAVSGTVGSLADASVRELTREIGCLARRSIATQGNAIIFLSDNGVFGLSFEDQYNLRGAERPLSEPIQPFIDRISRDLASDAVGVYFNNRYWLAVPLDTVARQGDATGNNAVLVYNLLNREWESVDTFADPNFVISNLLIATSGERNDLYAVSPTGGIHRLDSADEDYDLIATASNQVGVQIPIEAVMQTRAYMCGTDERKRFAEIALRLRSGTAQSDMAVEFSVEDPDNTATTTTVSQMLGEYLAAGDTADLRARVGGARGFNGSIRLTRVIGRPQVRGTKVSATVTNRSVISHS